MSRRHKSCWHIQNLIYLTICQNSTSLQADTNYSVYEYNPRATTLEICVDGFDYVPNANVNNDGNANVNDSNVQNDNAARLQMRLHGSKRLTQARTLLSQPPSIRCTSESFACNFRQLVSFASLSSRIALICKASTSACA